ncbi:hypothetical protein ACFYT4_36240 [Streptomyces sp. NPDC004609]|uniref:hypothetical protein n=1 Tax=Streptomyces sp. NPDC004609 TaxID=3364704 RepID=UPI0036977291
MRNKKKRRRSSSAPPVTDPHIQMLVNSVAELTALMATLEGEDPAAATHAAFTAAVDEFVENVVRFDAIRLIEVARQRFLPFAAAGDIPNAVEANTAHLELLTLVAYAVQQDAEV